MWNISVDEALARAVTDITPLACEAIALFEADGRVLGADIISPIDLPPFANSAMDGYAVIAADTRQASPTSPVRMKIAARVAAGQVVGLTITAGNVARIMTGAPLPPGADAVVKFEDTEHATATSVDLHVAVVPGQYVRHPGEDVMRGQMALSMGTTLAPSAIALLAAMGYSTVMCRRRPRVAIIGTGDELVQPGQPLPPGKIYDSNDFMIAALAKRAGAEVKLYGATGDQEASIQAIFANALADHPDLIITSGGVSVGDFDLVKDILAEMGEITFWQVRMRPGKPLAFGHVQGVPLVGLPGNPVAAFVGFSLFGHAIVRAMLGQDPTPPLLEAICAEPIRNGSQRRNFLRGSATVVGTQIEVRQAGGQLPTQLATLTHSNCLIVASEERTLYEAGETIPIMLIDPHLL